MILQYILIIFLTFYVAIYFKLISGLKKLCQARNLNQRYSVTIIIAARNEEKTITNCINALLKQDYPDHLVEIICVDDGSSDGTLPIMEYYATMHSNFNIIHLDTKQEGSKKRALTEAIKNANGEILLFTDADCESPPAWITEIISCFKKDIGVVVGFSPLVDRSNSFLGKLIELDSLFSATISAAGIGLNYPVTCTGRNFAYRKQIFYEVNGYSDILHSVSGDDDLFLHLVKKKTDWKTDYVISPASIIPSYQTKTLRQFFLQKTRHISAGKYYPLTLKLLYGIMHGINFIFYLYLFVSVITGYHLIEAAIVFIVKLITDYCLILQGAKLFQKLSLIKYFPVWNIFYIGYHIISSPFALIGKIRWGK